MDSTQPKETKQENGKERKQYRPKRQDGENKDGQKNEKRENNKEKGEDRKDKPEGEKKRGGNYKNRGGRNQFREKLEVTLDTVIPPLPKKEERLAEPNEDAHEKELDKISAEIEELYKKMNNAAREVISSTKSDKEGDKAYYDMIDLLKKRQEARGKAYDEFQAANTEREQYKKQLEEYFEKSQELRQKMKRSGKKSELEEDLRKLKLKLTSGRLTLQEEKQIIKEIEVLEISVPLAGPLEELDERFKDVKDNLKIAKRAASEKYDIYSKIREECREIQEKIQKSDDEWKKQKSETTPAIQKMKDEYKAKIDAQKEKKKELIKKHREAWAKYNEQQAEIDKIRKMQKIKERLIRDEERRKRNEEYAKIKKAQEEENREVPFLGELEICSQLLQYLNKLLPATEEVNEDSAKGKEDRIQEALKAEEWKKAKFEILKNKRDNDDEFIVNKKKSKNKKQNKEKEETTAQPLNHQFDALNSFDSIKVSPPLFVEKIPDAIKLVKEKQEYFLKMQAEAVKADEEKRAAKAEEAKQETAEKKDEEKTAEDKPKEQKSSPKKNKSQNQGNKSDIDLTNEKEFPSFVGNA